MKDLLSSFLSKIKNKAFVRRACLVLLLAVLTVGGILFATIMQKKSAEQAFLPHDPALVQPSDDSLEQEQAEEKEEPENIEESEEPAEPENEYIPVDDIRIPHCGEIYYSLSSKASDFYFENPSSNACFLKVSITRLDTKETIYSSTLISPGKNISAVGFAGKLTKAGSYSAMIKVDAYAIDRMMHLNSLVIDTVIHVY